MKILKYTFFFLAVVFTLLVTLTSSDVLFNKIIKYSHENFASNIDINLEQIKFEIKLDSLIKRDIVISSSGSCVSGSNFKICFKDLLIKFDFNLLNPLNPKFETLIVTVTEGYFKSTVKPKEQSELVVSELISQVYNSLDLVKNFYPEKMDINVLSFDLKSDQSVKNLSLNIDNLSLDLNFKDETQNLKVKLSKDQDFLKGELNFQNEKINFQTDLKLSFNEKYTLQTERTKILNVLKDPITFSLKSVLNEDELKLFVNDMYLKYEQSAILKIKTCELKTSYHQENDSILTCPEINLNIDQKIDFISSLKLNISDILDFDNSKRLVSAELKLKNLKKEEFEIDLDLKTKILARSGIFDYEIESFKWSAQTDHFEKIVLKLKNTSFALPAPINTMKGEVKLSSNKIADVKTNGFIIPLIAEIKLSDTQKNALELDFKGSFEYNLNQIPKLIGKGIIKKAYINIPPIDPLNTVPKLTKSSRIQKNIVIKNKEKKEASILYDIEISTLNNESIRFFYQYLEPSFNFGLKANLKNDKADYKILSNSKTTAKYLKREVILQSLILESKNDLEPTIQAELNYFASGYKIILKIIGTVNAPELLLSSNPSVPRQDIISLLIYNRKSNQISSSQKQSVGGTEAAIEDQALSLFSIWAFASTPIDYVSYDATSKTYSASITLPGNTSFQIGTNWESVNNLTLRKQLSDTWSIETSYNPNAEDSKQDVMLQKEINF